MTYADVLQKWSKHPRVMSGESLSGETWDDLIGEACFEGEEWSFLKKVMGVIEEKFSGKFVNGKWVPNQ